MGIVNKSNHSVRKLALRSANNGSPSGNRKTVAMTVPAVLFSSG